MADNQEFEQTVNASILIFLILMMVFAFRRVMGQRTKTYIVGSACDKGCGNHCGCGCGCHGCRHCNGGHPPIDPKPPVDPTPHPEFGNVEAYLGSNNDGEAFIYSVSYAE